MNKQVLTIRGGDQPIQNESITSILLKESPSSVSYGVTLYTHNGTM